MTTGVTIINNFFSNNYQRLVEMSTEYCHKYQYHLMQPKDIISEYYIHVLEKDSRVEKLIKLIQTTATTNVYKHNNQAFFHISVILWRLTQGKRTFNNDCNTDKLDITYCEEVFPIETHNDEISTTDYFGLEDVISAAEKLSKDEDWYKYKVWYDYYVLKFSYAELSQKYKLSTSPLFVMVQQYNQKIKKYLLSVSENNHL